MILLIILLFLSIVGVIGIVDVLFYHGQIGVRVSNELNILKR